MSTPVKPYICWADEKCWRMHLFKHCLTKMEFWSFFFSGECMRVPFIWNLYFGIIPNFGPNRYIITGFFLIIVLPHSFLYFWRWGLRRGSIFVKTWPFYCVTVVTFGISVFFRLGAFWVNVSLKWWLFRMGHTKHSAFFIHLQGIVCVPWRK